ncbi:MAG: hypothetical protein JOY90_34205 [Bradyrhizobium sp.]|nr:hypothetical protein [Bradyrhizobium sp.]
MDVGLVWRWFAQAQLGEAVANLGMAGLDKIIPAVSVLPRLCDDEASVGQPPTFDGLNVRQPDLSQVDQLPHAAGAVFTESVN